MAENNGADRRGQPRDPTEATVKGLVDLLELEPENPCRAELEKILRALVEVEATEELLSAEYDAAHAAYEAAPREVARPQRYEFSIEDPEPVDPEITARRDNAAEASQTQRGLVFDTQKELFVFLQEREKLDEVGLGAFVQALFHASPEDRLEYGRTLKKAFLELDANLTEGTLIYRQGPNTRGFYRVEKPGITVGIDSESIKKGPCAVVRTKPIAGSEIAANLNHGLNIRPTAGVEKGMALYKPPKGSRSPQSVEMLMVNCYDPEAKAEVQFLAGEAALGILGDESLSLAQRTQLAVAAAQQGVEVEQMRYLEQCQLSIEEIKEFRVKLVREMCLILMRTKIDEKANPASSEISSEKGEGGGLPLDFNLRVNDVEIIRILIRLCELDFEEAQKAIGASLVDLEQKLNGDVTQSSVVKTRIKLARDNLFEGRNGPMGGWFPQHRPSNESTS